MSSILLQDQVRDINMGGLVGGPNNKYPIEELFMTYHDFPCFSEREWQTDQKERQKIT